MGRSQRRLAFRTVSFSFLCLVGARIASAQDSSVRLSFEFIAEDLAVETHYLPSQFPITDLRLKGAGLSGDPGFPLMPCLTRVVVLPPGAQMGKLAVEPGKEYSFQGIRCISWAQLPSPGRDPVPPKGVYKDGDPFNEPPEFIGPDPRLEQYGIWPPVEAEILQAEPVVAGYTAVTLAIYPVRWHRSEHRVSLQANFTVVLPYAGGVPVKEPGSYGEAMRLECLRGVVENGGLLPPISIPPEPEELDASYLIITDNFQWSEDKTKGPALAGDMVAEFERLAAWKRQKGLRSEVVTVSDILARRYGDFGTSAADLQETLRKFLKHARAEWGTYWVLLGGDVEVIPPRTIVGSVLNDNYCFFLTDNSQPPAGYCYWDAGTKAVWIHDLGWVGPDVPIVSRKTGRLFAQTTSPSAASPGWCYTTSDSYSVESFAPTEYVKLVGPEADTSWADFHVVRHANSIPTDLYYASLDHPDYGAPGIHDWDANGNGLWGQFWRDNTLDKAYRWADVALGRAPASSGAEAAAFVDKVIAYERYQGFPPEFGRRLLLAAANWGGQLVAWPSDSDPPPDESYFSAAGDTTAKINFKGRPRGITENRLVASYAGGGWAVIPYNTAADAGNLGYCFCSDGGYDPCWIQTVMIEGSPVDFPVVVSRVRVRGPADAIHPALYFFDDVACDLAVTEKEELKEQFASRVPQLDVRARLYEDILDTPCYPAADLFSLSETRMESALNEGYNIVSLTGHGNAGGCAGVNRAWVPGLTNGYRGGIVYADSCSTNAYDEDAAVSEKFLTSPLGGVAAYVGNSRYSWVGEGDDLERAFWLALRATRHVGQLHNSKAPFARGDCQIWANYALNLMGDPEMELWLGAPASLIAAHPRRVDQGQEFTVLVTDPGGTPIPGAFLTMIFEKAVLQRHHTGPTGEVRLSTTGREVGDVLVITVFKQDHIPYEGTVTVDSPFHLPVFIRCDSNGDDRIDISDAIHVLNFLFLGTAVVTCEDASDANDDGKVDISDAVRILGFLFLGDKLPPGTTPGKPQEDPTPNDGLGCDVP